MHDNDDNNKDLEKKLKKKKTQDLIAALSLSLSRDPFSRIDCHSSKIVHLVSSRDHVTSNNDEKYI